MRFAVTKTIYQKALKNKNIVFLTADLGHAMQKEFVSNLPGQYYNTGIAEQNMIGLAAGLALAGKKVFAYSIVPFITMRAYEQIKIDICYQNLDVTLIGMGGGLAYGPYANTHCSIEDIGVMRVLPNMKIVCPANPLEAKQITNQLFKIKGPTYLRIGRGKEADPKNEYKIEFKKAKIINLGKDLTIFTTGTILPEAEEVASILAKKNLSVEIINMHTIKPIHKEIIIDRLKKRRAIFALEEHNIIGGLGSAVAEIICEAKDNNIIFKRFGIKDKYLPIIGQQSYLRQVHGISAKTVSQTIYRLMV